MKTVIIISAAIALVLAATTIQYIPSGRSGAADRKGGTEILESGIHFALPWDRAATYPVEPAKVSFDTRAEVPAGEVASKFDLEISVDPARLTEFHKSQGPAWQETLAAQRQRIIDWMTENGDPHVANGRLHPIPRDFDPAMARASSGWNNRGRN